MLALRAGHFVFWAPTSFDMTYYTKYVDINYIFVWEFIAYMILIYTYSNDIYVLSKSPQ